MLKYCTHLTTEAEKLNATDSSFERGLRYLPGRHCSALDNFALSSLDTTGRQHVKETCLIADHPGLTSTFSTFWIIDPMSFSVLHRFQRTKLPEYYVPPSLPIHRKALKAVAEEGDPGIHHITILWKQGLSNCVRGGKEYHEVPLNFDHGQLTVHLAF